MADGSYSCKNHDLSGHGLSCCPHCTDDLQTKLREAQEERDNQADIRKALMRVNDIQVEDLAQRTRERDAAIERGVAVIAELDRATDMEHVWMIKAEAAEREAPK